MADLAHRLVHGFLRFFLLDEVRLFELFSALNLAAWSVVLTRQPDLIGGNSYTGFGDLAPSIWVIIFGFGAFIQVVGLIAPRSLARDHIRFAAMSCAAGLWSIVAWNFWRGDLTTANLNYTLIAICAVISGSYLGWKTSE